MDVTAFTVPETEIDWVVAQVAANVKFPDNVPVAVLFVLM